MYMLLDRVTVEGQHIVQRVLKINCAEFVKLTAIMEEFANLIQPRYFIGESLVSSDENIEMHYML